MWKDFFYFTKSEKKGILVLICATIVLFIIGNIPGLFVDKEVSPYNTEEAKKEYESFLSNVREYEVKENKHHKKTSSKPKPVLSVFDPNTADSTTFIRLGLPPWMAGNILKYRLKGGRFKRSADFRKIYGLTEEQFRTLEPYIQIEEITTNNETPTLRTEKAEPQDTVRVATKYPAGTIVDLNLADTIQLKMIPGIGGFTAKKIVQYRNQLGGFYSVAQLDDIKLDSKKFADWFTIDSNSAITKVNINKAGIEKLKSHPYINFYQAKAIVEYRKKRGRISALNQLSLLEEFSEKDFERLNHYISFE